MTIVEERTAVTGGVDTHSEVHVATGRLTRSAGCSGRGSSPRLRPGTRCPTQFDTPADFQGDTQMTPTVVVILQARGRMKLWDEGKCAPRSGR